MGVALHVTVGRCVPAAIAPANWKLMSGIGLAHDASTVVTAPAAASNAAFTCGTKSRSAWKSSGAFVTSTTAKSTPPLSDGIARSPFTSAR